MDYEIDLPPLSLKERNKARKMLERYFDEGTREIPEHMWYAIEDCKKSKAELKRELQVMLMLGVKAEIQIVDRRRGGLEGWAREKLRHF